MVLDIPPIVLPLLSSVNIYQVIAAGILCAVIMATSKQPKYIIIIIPLLFIACNMLVVTLWNIYLQDQTNTALLCVSVIIIASIWRENKPDIVKK